MLLLPWIEIKTTIYLWDIFIAIYVCTAGHNPVWDWMKMIWL